jgi:hypothetical protein
MKPAVTTVTMADTGTVCVTSNGRSGHLPMSATPEEINVFGATLGVVGTLANWNDKALSAVMGVCSDVASRLHGDAIRPVSDDGTPLDEAEVLPSIYSGPLLSKCKSVVAAAAWMDRDILFSSFTTMEPCYGFTSAITRAVDKNPSRTDAIHSAIRSTMSAPVAVDLVNAEYSKQVLKGAAVMESALVKTARKKTDSAETKADRAKRGRRLESAEPAAVAELVSKVAVGNDSAIQMVAMVECYRNKTMEQRAEMFCFYSDLVAKFAALDTAESGS